VVGNTVVVIGETEVTTWSLPAGGFVSGARMGPEDCSWKIRLNGLQEGYMSRASISPDFRHIAFTVLQESRRILCIHDASTGEYLGHRVTSGGIPLFTPDGCNVWCADYFSGESEVWRVGGEMVLEKLDHKVGIEHPPEGYPWGSSRGYRVTEDWWILGPDGKRLLMLPPPWRSIYAVQRVWKGQFLALLHEGLSEPVILEMEP
jgi:hypothetical protein